MDDKQKEIFDDICYEFSVIEHYLIGLGCLFSAVDNEKFRPTKDEVFGIGEIIKLIARETSHQRSKMHEILMGKTQKEDNKKKK